MISNPRVSWLGSVYKGSEPNQLYISLISILRQNTNYSFEIVLVFDGPVSEDVKSVINSILKISNLLKIFKLKENQGLGLALNYGISKCKGDLIARFDTDDVNHLDRLQTQVKYMDDHPYISVSSTSAFEFISSPKNKFVNCEIRKACPTNYIKFLMSIKNPVNHPTVMFRRKDVIRSDSYLNQKFFEDYLLWLRMKKNNYNFGSIMDPLVFVRVDDLYTRRYSLSYLKYEISFIKNSFFINRYIPIIFLPFFICRLVIRLIPNQSFQAFLRKRLKKDVCKNPDFIENL